MDDDEQIDDQSIKDLAAYLGACLEREEQAVNYVLHILYDRMPTWIPDPSIERVRRTIQNLINDGFPAVSIPQRVVEAEKDKLIFPGIVTNPTAFAQSIYELADLRYAISRGKFEGLRILAGKIAEHGQRFKDHSDKPRRGGAARQAIAKLLANNPEMKNPELWEEITKKPPKGWIVNMPRHFRFEPDLQGPNPDTDHMSYHRFCNVCGEERGKVRKKITG